MRNLKNVRLAEVHLQNELPLTATAWDTASDAVICTFGPTEANPIIELRRKHQDSYFTDPVGAEVFECIASWDAPCPLPDLRCDRVLSLHYFADNLTACLVLEGGDIVVVREDPLPGEEKIEIVGSVDVGISAAAWSPDEELLALTTRANTFLYMTREFENVAEITFTPEDLKVSQHVSVGWGKRETQFQGKRAKALRDPTIPEKVDEGRLSSNDDGRTTISWRGDGAYVAVNSIEAGFRRVIRVYSREGALDSVSEPVDGLEGALSWRPYGNLIAGIQRLEDKVEVVFFERNGLRHGEFSLRLNEEERASWASDIHLSWNVDSTVLAVLFRDRIQFWTMGNYHYYLKEEVPVVVDPDYPHPFAFKWHQEKALRSVACGSASILDLDFVFDVSHGSTFAPHDVGAVAVIDGMDSNVVDVAFSKSGTRIAVLMKDCFSIYMWSLKTRPVPSPILESSHPLPDNLDNRPRQIAFLNENEVYILRNSGPNSTCIQKTTLETRSTTTVYQTTDSGQILTIFPAVGHEALWFSHVPQPGRPIAYCILKASPEEDVQVDSWDQSPAVDTHWARAVHLSDDERILISLSRTGALYANNQLLAKNCTSFLVTQAHILFTTSQHLLKFVHLTKAEEMEVPADTPETDERCRSIERGSKLVSVMPSKFAVTLQAPRGNIETIYPRALVLAGIRNYIDRKDYRSAFLACRSQMVDMNILHDYAPEQFLENVALFLDQVKRVDFIDEFLSRLSEDDVSQTLYKDTLKTPREVQTTTQPEGTASFKPTTKTSKVNRICDAFLATLEKRMDTNLHNLVTAHDPREYLPFLRKLQQLPEDRRRFEIDNYLGRWAKALKHLHALNAYDEIRVYVIKHELYKEAIDLFKYQPEQLRDITHIYADFLHDHSKYKEAGIAYESLSLYEDAYKCYHLAHLWRESLYCALMVPLSEADLTAHALALTTTLTEESRDYVSAAQIHAEHLHDIPAAARLLCRGSRFADATRILTLHGKKDLIPEIVDTGLADAMGATTDLLADFRSQLNAQVPRIRELRERRAADPLAYFGGDPTTDDLGVDIPDNVSLAPTDASTLAGRTMFTRYTGKTASSRHTSKTRRREERKRARGKKGTVYEEEYLVNSVRRLIERVNSTVPEVETLVDALLRRGMRERAVAIEKAMQEVLKMCAQSREEVFGALEQNESEKNAAEGLDKEDVDGAEELRPRGGQRVFAESVRSVLGTSIPGREVPPVKEMKKSALLN
ncbi:killer toxin sensitivity protein (IKI3), putative [Aspergillus fumigatus A1163]|uniref:Elongator complex protein 1 n=2 Tax=Aspergillus fumigatus TaxID=746128 RepID=Q4WNW0_ASPFU|nr:killer toxin sensitivity protein (IKI3), putative [Aspergillus fumigatus Af293]EAL90074.1 killer toxin sensitivity protein (IKI3), putative [Aspergillus fumigatus Af293]EDP50091.1 killer toxin sensitivity protein (IKI3), putative [Aspergillus fumigatus A1163]